MQSRDYECFEPLSEGPDWTVYEGSDSRLDREVAIKVLRPESQVDDAYWDGMRARAATPHEGLIGVYDLDPERGWVVLQRAAGDLSTSPYTKPMDPTAAARLLQQVASGLDQLHSLGRVHGGVIRSNVLVDAQGRAKLNASPGFAVGGTTAPPPAEQRHVAPEFLNQDAFGEPGPASDLYCLGFLGLELLLGKRFDSLASGVSGAGWIAWHASPASQLPNLADRLGDAPAGLVRVLTKLTAKRPEDRYASAHEAALALAECCGAATIAPVERTVKKPSLLDRVTDPAAWSRLMESPSLLAKSAGGLVAFCLVTTLITANALPKKGSFTVIATDSKNNHLDGTVQLDGIEVGSTHQRIQTVARHYTYVVSAEGYLPRQQTFTLVGGDDLELPIELERETAPIEEEISLTQLEVRVQPGEATVTVRNAAGETLGQEAGTLVLEAIEPGRYDVVAECAGYQTYDDSFVVYPGDDRHLEAITLDQTDFNLTIQSTPPGATVFIDGSPAGKTGIDQPITRRVPRGKHQVVLRLANHETFRDTIEVVHGEYLEPALKPIPDNSPKYRVVFRSEPPGAEIVLADREAVQTPRDLRLKPGFHEVTVRRPGQPGVRSRINVQSEGDIFFWKLPARTIGDPGTVAWLDPSAAGGPAGL